MQHVPLFSIVPAITIQANNYEIPDSMIIMQDSETSDEIIKNTNTSSYKRSALMGSSLRYNMYIVIKVKVFYSKYSNMYKGN